MPALSQTAIQDFIDKGFVRIDDAFPRRLAADCRQILWPDLGCDPNDPATWTRPVVRLAGYGQEPFRRAFDRPRLHAGFDQLVGRGRWRPRRDLGTFVVRFPCASTPEDTGWHIDNSFADVETQPGDYSAWRANTKGH